MTGLQDLRDELLSDGRISEDEVDVLRDYLRRRGSLDMEDVKFLVELLAGAREVCPAFDELFFPVLKQVLLEDGRIGLDEQFYLLKMLYADGVVRDSEKQFLRELRAEVRETSPEFEQLCETALAAPARGWSNG